MMIRRTMMVLLFTAFAAGADAETAKSISTEAKAVEPKAAETISGGEKAAAAP